MIGLPAGRADFRAGGIKDTDTCGAEHDVYRGLDRRPVMNYNKDEFEKHLKAVGVGDDLIGLIVNAPYQQSEDDKQDNANYCAAVMARCDELLEFNQRADMMLSRACCKGGFRLNNAKMIARDHGDKTLEEKLELLGQQKYMGHPRLTERGEIYTGTCAGSGPPENLRCSCWRFGGKFPSEGLMPLSYCLCCGGHFVFHYQKALGLKLRVKQVVTSVFADPPQYCSFILEILGEMPRPKRGRKPRTLTTGTD